MAERSLVLRTVGFVTSVVGGFASALGTTQTWAMVGIGAAGQGMPPLPTKGTDTIEGKVVVGLCVAGLVAVLLLRAGKGTDARRGVAPVVLVCGVAATAVSAFVLIRAHSTLVPASTAIARRLSSADPRLSYQTLLHFLNSPLLRYSVDVRPALPLTLAGGVLLLAGGVMSVLWARSGTPGTAIADEVEPA